MQTDAVEWGNYKNTTDIKNDFSEFNLEDFLPKILDIKTLNLWTFEAFRFLKTEKIETKSLTL